MTTFRCFLILLINAVLLSPAYALQLPSRRSQSHTARRPDHQASSLETRHLVPGSTGQCGPRAGCVSNAATSDCCGPTGRNIILPDTCFASANLTTTPGAYDINCFSSGTSALQLSSPVGYYAATVVCNSINNGTAPHNAWYWYSPQSGFAVGVWLPGNTGDAPCPHFEQCTQAIYYMMIQGCANSAGFNGASVNVVTLPDNLQTGQAFDSGYPSYIMAPAPLTN